jgi:hypothetical protein
MSRQQGYAPTETDASKRAPGKKDRPWQLWLTYQSAFHRGTRTFRNGWYRTEDEARRAGEGFIRKHPSFYLSFDVEK